MKWKEISIGEREKFLAVKDLAPIDYQNKLSSMSEAALRDFNAIEQAYFQFSERPHQKRSRRPKWSSIPRDEKKAVLERIVDSQKPTPPNQVLDSNALVEHIKKTPFNPPTELEQPICDALEAILQHCLIHDIPSARRIELFAASKAKFSAARRLLAFWDKAEAKKQNKRIRLQTKRRKDKKKKEYLAARQGCIYCHRMLLPSRFREKEKTCNDCRYCLEQGHEIMHQGHCRPDKKKKK